MFGSLVRVVMMGVMLASEPVGAQTGALPIPPPAPPRLPDTVQAAPTRPASPPRTLPAHVGSNRPASPVVTAPPRDNAQRPAQTARPAVPVPPPEVPAPVEPVLEPGKGSVTNLPIPRFAALKTDEVNLRTGPGQRYPVDWVYKRRDLPVQIEREFDVWRLVRDPEGVKGWVHQATLTGRRTFFVLGEERAMRRQASDDAGVVARLRPGVVGLLKRCEVDAAWCQVQVGEHKGWMKRSELWGVLGREAVN